MPCFVDVDKKIKTHYIDEIFVLLCFQMFKVKLNHYWFCFHTNLVHGVSVLILVPSWLMLKIVVNLRDYCANVYACSRDASPMVLDIS